MPYPRWFKTFSEILTTEDTEFHRGRRNMSRVRLTTVIIVLISASARAQDPVGIFENHSDVGTVLHPGSTTFDSAKNTYSVRGSGENMWATADAFQFAWKR